MYISLLTFTRAWRAILALPLSDVQYHRALRAFPTAVLPHVARPLQVRGLGLGLGLGLGPGVRT